MSNVATTAAPGTQPQTTSQTARNRLSDTYDNFLTLLTTQLQYQDPMQPMDSAQFTNQLVLYSQVEQQISQNEKLDTMILQQGASHALTSLGFIGLEAEMDVKEFKYEGEPLSFNYILPDDAAEGAKLRITDATGKLIATADAETKEGRHEFVWNGKNKEGETVRPGTYNIEVSATGLDKEALKVPTTMYGTVSGIEAVGGDTFLIIGDQKIPVYQVRSAREPIAASAS
ncbi:flagellar hook assembly protein FlgD [Arenibaculum sp.]|jgi:flagellar basal-body rod modification protein FlgD|uniref:flagellar hook assembly protein FlgD n=1 Tax=Arenibaculum sp. TaxID=2865862 RepID=UPI002E0FACD3|nr:flagellar hook assembly protein FlgD [Arenibaculum sp.]